MLRWFGRIDILEYLIWNWILRNTVKSKAGGGFFEIEYFKDLFFVRFTGDAVDSSRVADSPRRSSARSRGVAISHSARRQICSITQPRLNFAFFGIVPAFCLRVAI